MSGWMDSFNQAVGLTEDPAENARLAADKQDALGNRALDLQKEQYDYQKQLNEPFYQIGLPAAAQYAATVNGQPVMYRDLNNVTAWANPMKPQDTEAYKWQQQQMEQNTGRSLRAMGRYNSTYGMNALTRGNRDLAASEYDKQLGRLADLTNVARGGASSLAGMSSNYANGAASGLNAMGANSANALLAGGLMRNNASQNNMQNMFSLANLGMKAYDRYGGGGGGSYGGYGDLYSSTGGDINNVDFGNDWGSWEDGSAA